MGPVKSFLIRSIWLRSLEHTTCQVSSSLNPYLSEVGLAELTADPGLALAGLEISDGDLLPLYNTTVSAH